MKTSAHKHEPISVTWEQVATFRLARHHLLERAPKKDLLSVVRDMTGAQAQLPSAAQISLWSRVRGLQVADIDAALKDRTLVKAACMRRTLFLVPSEHLATFVRGSAHRGEKEIQWARGKGVPDRDIDAAIDAALSTLDEPLTRPEIADRVCRKLGVRVQDTQGGGWGNQRKLVAVPVGSLRYPVVDLLHLAAARGVVCYGPYRRSEPTFVRADAWIPNWHDVPREQAERSLLRLYLQAFGPATVADFALWSGMSLTEARRIWALEQMNFASVLVDGWEAAIHQDNIKKLTQAGLERPLVRLLPYFDSFLLGHKQREHLVATAHQSKVYRPQGWIYPVVLVDGRVGAIWEYARQGHRLHIKVTSLGPLSRRIITGIQEEAGDLARFLDSSTVEVQID